MSSPTKVLFLAEHVSFSQIVRCLALARGLDRESFDVHFACASFDPRLFGQQHPATAMTRWPLRSLDRSITDAALARGDRLYDESTLASYVDDELRLFDRVRPDVVVSDLRWSTAISAPLAGVPLATLVNAFWSPFVEDADLPLPDHPILSFVGIARAEKWLHLVMPRVLAHFARPVNRLRERRGLAPLGSLRDVLTFGDRVLFPDDPSMFATRDSPPGHVFLGPILWSPDVPVPASYDSLGHERPFVYATLGSTGDLRCLSATLDALGRLDVDAVVATAGRVTGSLHVPPNVRVCDVAPGDALARRAAAVVCNGGASTAYQALAEGTPVVGLPSNLDQFLAMRAIERAGAGVSLRASTATPDAIATAIRRAAEQKSAAVRIAASFARLDPHEMFRAVIGEMAAAA